MKKLSLHLYSRCVSQLKRSLMSLNMSVQIVMQLTNLDVSSPSSPVTRSRDAEEHVDGDVSPTRGPPSETSSQEWDRVTDPGSQTPASS